MSAECNIHGCDLVGHQDSEGGLQCPQCVLDEQIKVLQHDLAEAERDRIGTAQRNRVLRSALEEIVTDWDRVDLRTKAGISDLIGTMARCKDLLAARDAVREWRGPLGINRGG